MNSEKKKRLESSGWTVGGAADFLQLSPEEAKFIESKLALAAADPVGGSPLLRPGLGQQFRLMLIEYCKNFED